MDIIGRYGKNIIVEKPTFMRPEQMREAYDLAESKGAKIFAVYQNRYNKAVRFVKDAVSDGSLGEIRMASVRMRWCRPQRYYDRDPWRGTWSHDGGALTNQGVHYLDILRHLGGEVKRVNAVADTLAVDVEVEDAIVRPVELAVSGVDDVKRIRGTAVENFGTVIVEVIEGGDVDYRRVVPILRRHGFDGYLEIEFVNEEDKLEALAIDAAFLRDLASS